MILFFYGRPGAGKSTIGRELMFRLNVPFIDCDDIYNKRDRSAILTDVISDEASDEYLERVIEYLEAYDRFDRIVIASQSLFRETQRCRVKERLGPKVTLCCLDISEEESIARVGNRDSHMQAGIHPERFRALPYSLEHYKREEHYYEEPMTYDLKIDATAPMNEVIEAITGGILNTK